MTEFLGSDNDDLLGDGTGDDLLVGLLGNDTLRGLDGNDVLAGDRLLPLPGTPGRDRDVLFGDFGNDRLIGGAAGDTLFGGAGNDTLTGGYLSDEGPDGDDALFGDAGDDVLSGGFGTDRLNGGPGADSLFGGAGRDRLIGSFGDDRLEGGTGIDTLDGGPGNDTILGGFEDDLVIDLSGNNLISAIRGRVETGDGNDFIQARIVRSGDGNDTARGFGDGSFVAAGAGNDQAGGHTVYGQAGHDRLTTAFFAAGGPGDDTIEGGGLLRGDRGDDRISVIDEQSGSRAVGGLGHDALSSDANNVSLRGNQGEDTFRTFITDLDGINTIEDFEFGIDAIGIPYDFPDSPLSSFDEVDFVQSGNDVIITIGDGYLALVLGSEASAFSIDDFFGYSI